MHIRTILPRGTAAGAIRLRVCFGGYHLHALKRLSLPRAALLVAEIQRIVCDRYELPRRAMSAASLAWEIARPRQVAMFLCRELTGRSLPDIRRRFGGRDHSIVLHALRAVEKRRREDPELDADLRRLRARLEGRG